MFMKYNKIIILVFLVWINIPHVFAQNVKLPPGWVSIDEINTSYLEFSPTISPDGVFLIFGSDRPGGVGDKDLWISYYSNKKWSKPVNLKILNSRDHDQEPFITYDGKSVIFSSDRLGGFGVGDLYISSRKGNVWSAPVNLGPTINTKDSEKMPSISMNNDELYFSRIPVNYSTRSLEHSKHQIYLSRKKNTWWQKPVKLDHPVNVLARDCAPRIMPDSKTLLFCSTRKGGKGGYDIWAAKRKTIESPWSIVSNLLYLNTADSEAHFTFTIDGKRMFMASLWNRAQKFDIYEYNIKDQVFDSTITLQGRITNKKNGEPINAAVIGELFSDSGKKFKIETDPLTGEYSLSLPGGDIYSFTIESPGFMFNSERLDLRNLKGSSVTNKDFGLHPLAIGENIIIDTIYFDPNSYKLRKNSELALSRIADILKQNPGLKLMIKGHVAKVQGGTINPQLLSEKRAQAVRDYLISKGIRPDRLSSKGLGSTEPIGDNNTEAGRAMNRRTEFEILGTE